MLIAAVFAILLVADPPQPEYNSQPTLRHKVEPLYSKEAQDAHLQGTVELRIVVREDGTPVELKVARGLGLGLDEKAIEAVQQWRFSPAVKKGAPVPVVATVQVNFRLLDAVWALNKMSYDAASDVTDPRLVHAEYPKKKPVTGGSLRVTFMIDERGTPGEIESSSTIPPELLDALKKWRFNPGTRDGTAIPVRANFEFWASSRN